eukprot:g6750.t1
MPPWLSFQRKVAEGASCAEHLGQAANPGEMFRAIHQEPHARGDVLLEDPNDSRRFYCGDEGREHELREATAESYCNRPSRQTSRALES